jgi:hypothetical protein
MVLLYIKHGIVILVTPLKLLGKQFVDVLAKNNLKAVSMTAANGMTCSRCVTVNIHQTEDICG